MPCFGGLQVRRILPSLINPSLNCTVVFIWLFSGLKWGWLHPLQSSFPVLDHYLNTRAARCCWRGKPQCISFQMGSESCSAMLSCFMSIAQNIAQQSSQTFSSLPKDKALFPQEGLVYVTKKIYSTPEKIKTTIFNSKYLFLYFHLIFFLPYHTGGQMFPFLPQINLPTCVLDSISSFLLLDLAHVMITTRQHLLFFSVLRLEVCRFLFLHFAVANSSVHRDLLGHLKDGRVRWGWLTPKLMSQKKGAAVTWFSRLLSWGNTDHIWFLKSRQESRFPYEIW